MNPPDLQHPGVWRELFGPAMRLMAHLETQVADPKWTFGGGTVLMLRIGHRQSKDIDLFAYFSPSWTAFQADRGRAFSVIVDGVSN
jgi:hypothetical protein